MYRECTAVLEPSGCQPAPSLASSGGQARGHDTKEAEMRTHGREGQMGKRFAIVIGVAAAGVMALGAQTAAAAPVHKYDTKLTITHEGHHTHQGVFWHGSVLSDRDRSPVYHRAKAVRK